MKAVVRRGRLWIPLISSDIARFMSEHERTDIFMDALGQAMDAFELPTLADMILDSSDELIQKEFYDTGAHSLPMAG